MWIDEQKQNFMTLLWKQGDHVGPKILLPKKMACPIPYWCTCTNLFHKPKSTISLLLFPIPGRLMGSFPRGWGKRYQRDPFSFFKCFLYESFWLDETDSWQLHGLTALGYEAKTFFCLKCPFYNSFILFWIEITIFGFKNNDLEFKYQVLDQIFFLNSTRKFHIQFFFSNFK